MTRFLGLNNEVNAISFNLRGQNCAQCFFRGEDLKPSGLHGVVHHFSVLHRQIFDVVHFDCKVWFDRHRKCCIDTVDLCNVVNWGSHYNEMKRVGQRRFDDFRVTLTLSPIFPLWVVFFWLLIFIEPPILLTRLVTSTSQSPDLIFNRSHIQNLPIIQRFLKSQLQTLPSPSTEGPHLPLRLTGKLGDILGSDLNTSQAYYYHYHKTPLFPQIVLLLRSRNSFTHRIIPRFINVTFMYQISRVKSLTFSQSTPVDVVLSSPPQVVSQTLIEDSFTGSLAPSRLPEKDQVLLLPEQDLKIDVPRRILGQTEIQTLLQMTAKLVSEFLVIHPWRKRNRICSEQVIAKDLQLPLLSVIPLHILQLTTIQLISTRHPWTHYESTPNAERSAQPEDDSPLDLPHFIDTTSMLRFTSTSRRRVLGKMDDVDVFVNVIGGVETHDYDREDDEFFGKCIVRINDYKIRGYCLGSIGTSGTGIIICQDECLIAYSPPNAVDNEWPPMKETIEAIIIINQYRDISLERIADVEVESLAVWWWN